MAVRHRHAGVAHYNRTLSFVQIRDRDSCLLWCAIRAPMSFQAIALRAPNSLKFLNIGLSTTLRQRRPFSGQPDCLESLHGTKCPVNRLLGDQLLEYAAVFTSRYPYSQVISCSSTWTSRKTEHGVWPLMVFIFCASLASTRGGALDPALHSQ